jgi:hypothetical protein
LPELEYIKATLAGLVLTNKRLRLTKFSRHFGLREACSSPNGLEQGKQNCAVARRLCLGHTNKIKHYCHLSQNRIFWDNKLSRRLWR